MLTVWVPKSDPPRAPGSSDSQIPSMDMPLLLPVGLIDVILKVAKPTTWPLPVNCPLQFLLTNGTVHSVRRPALKQSSIVLRTALFWPLLSAMDWPMRTLGAASPPPPQAAGRYLT